MKLPKMYKGQIITGRIEMAECEMDKVRQIVAEDKKDYGIVALRGCYETLFVDGSKGVVNPDLTITRGVVVSYRKDDNDETFLTHDECLFITDKKDNIYGKLSVEKYKTLRADLFFDPIKECEIVDLGAKGAMSSYNIEETLHYTNKESFTIFFKNIDIADKIEKASEL